MGILITTPTARRQLGEIVEYIAKENLEASLKWLDTVETTLRLLSEQPGIGQSVQTKRFGTIRRRVVGSYLIYYRPIESGIVVLMVVHGARDQNRLV
jgi:toxin ParE1/3/4